MLTALFSYFVSGPREDLDPAVIRNAVIDEKRCPDCSARFLYKGKSTGMITDAYCIKPECRDGFRVTSLSPTHRSVRRIRKAPMWKYRR